MIYKHYAGFITNLADTLSDIDRDLPVPEQHLALLKRRLSPDSYTFLKLFDGTKTEYIRVSLQGGNLYIDRGLELTTPTSFPKGTCVKWELTPTAVRDIVCQMPCCPQEV